ncbi:MAG: tRNA (adenosine(37)-N6)-dimethylallyltransferase MiaA [Bacilli bacterium]
MKKTIVIVGPTSVGKTRLSIELSKIFNGEVINADSIQIYKELNIGSAKIKDEEKENVVHHLLDIKDSNEEYTIYDFQKDGRKIIEKLYKKNKTPIVVGGSFLYIKSLLFDYKFDKEIKYDFSKFSNKQLFNKLMEIKPDLNVHINNRKRLERYMNYYKNNGSLNESKIDNILYECIFIGLTTDRSILYKRINDRVDIMFKEGLLKEVKNLYKIKDNRILRSAIGYKELYDYLDGKCTLEYSIEKIKQNSRNFAKRQYTFLNNKLNVKWFDVNFDNFNETIENIKNYIININEF